MCALIAVFTDLSPVSVLKIFSMAGSSAKSETNSFHNAGSKRAWMRLPS